LVGWHAQEHRNREGQEVQPDAATKHIFKAAVQEAQVNSLRADVLQPAVVDGWSWSPPTLEALKRVSRFKHQSTGRGCARLGQLRRVCAAEKDRRKLGVSLHVRDSHGERLSGDRTTPARSRQRTAKQYWSVIVYDVLTCALVRESRRSPGFVQPGNEAERRRLG